MLQNTIENIIYYCEMDKKKSLNILKKFEKKRKKEKKKRLKFDSTQVIELKVRKLQVGFLKETRCEGAYIQFSDGSEDVEDETGRYCGYVSGNTTRYEYLRNYYTCVLPLQTIRVQIYVQIVMRGRQKVSLSSRIACDLDSSGIHVKYIRVRIIYFISIPFLFSFLFYDTLICGYQKKEFININNSSITKNK